MEKMAGEVRLAHGIFGDFGRKNFLSCVEDWSLKAGGGKQTSGTNNAEKILCYPPSVYLYAGRVFPSQSVSAVLVYNEIVSGDGEGEKMSSGTATPFDTGKVALGKSNLVEAPKIGKIAMKGYGHEHHCTLQDWRSYFAFFLTKFFSAPEDYWGNGPKELIDGTDFALKTGDTKWKDWTFETRVVGALSLEGCDLIFVNKAIKSEIERRVKEQPEFSLLSDLCTYVENPLCEAEDYLINNQGIKTL
ncbi:MAG: hypothetical protein L3K26_14095 [Candidatus Hydrogenedentes bacterium]|nr:hypothetical protein [Candidatus Hydrogenedentota bacterium]